LYEQQQDPAWSAKVKALSFAPGAAVTHKRMIRTAHLLFDHPVATGADTWVDK